MDKRLYEKLNGWPSAVVGAVVLVGLAFFGYRTYEMGEVDKAQILLELENARTEKYALVREVRAREEIIDSLGGQIGDIANTVGTLEKLSQTDEELLKKYSKIYFLNENYIPPNLSDIDDKYLVSTTKNYMVYSKVWPYLRDLLDRAHRDGVKLMVASAYRSFATQSSLKSSYVVSYGSGANKFSADQGYSEHQLGTALDFTTEKLGANFTAFGSDPAYKWLLDNAHRYGFILSYPSDNTYYKFEPWHWRYVGVGLATRLHDDKKHFYDLDQREIDKYLIDLFD